MPTKSITELQHSVPQSVFVTDHLNNILLPDMRTIENNILNFLIDDTSDANNSVSCTMHKLFTFDKESFPLSDSMTDSTITCNATDDDSVGNASLATLKVYEVFGDNIQFCFHGPKIIPKNETPATICMVNTIGAIHSRRLFHILLDSGASC